VLRLPHPEIGHKLSLMHISGEMKLSFMTVHGQARENVSPRPRRHLTERPTLVPCIIRNDLSYISILVNSSFMGSRYRIRSLFAGRGLGATV
jgi:hypothetical protein